MTLGTLHTQVKREARVQGTDELDEHVYDVIREIHDQHTERQRFDELLVVDTDIILSDATSAYNLPEDFQHLKEVRFAYDGSAFRELDVRGDFHQKRSIVGLPKFYEKTGSSLRLYPYDSVKDTMGLHIDYYRRALLDNSADDMPVNKLVPLVKREAIARVHMYYKETASASAYKAMAQEAIMGIQSSTETGN